MGKCDDPNIIRDQFRLVQNMIARYSILGGDGYGFDGTGFQMGLFQ
jgi:hypothetical protein